jgi:hypothetical protein
MPLMKSALGYDYAVNWETDTNLRECFRNKYIAQKGLEAKGIRATDPCFLTWIDKDHLRMQALNPDACPEPKPPVTCCALGALAAQRIGEGSHRLATKEEMEKYHNDMRAREKWCADQTLASQKQQAVVHSMAFAEAAKLLGPNLSSKAGNKKD